MTGLAGKAILVSGGTSGIGRATALAFAREGARVAVAGRDAGRGKALVDEIVAGGGEAVFVSADLSARDGADHMVTQALDRLGRLDVAFNNAGHQEKRALLAEQTDAVYDTVFDTNLRSVFQAMRAEIAAMLAGGGGVIVNNASVSGVRNPNPGLSLYSASKAAVISMTKAAALEYAPQGIRINMVTPMMLGSGIADMSAVAAGLPVRRMGEPEEVAAAVLWLASDAASFVVGHNLCVDGGFLAQ